MAHAAIIFPPQWSPFQPPLSLPSLKAWVEARTSHSVTCLDMNVALYQFLLSSDFASRPEVLESELGHVLRSLYASIVPELVRGLRGGSRTLGQYYSTITGVESLFRLISERLLPFEIGLDDFYLRGTEFDPETIEARISTSPKILADFIDAYLDVHLNAFSRADLIGLSCIGQQQLYFTLLIAYRIRTRWAKPIIVGGTVLSRILYRGCLPSHWFGQYFDYICMHEGERPLEELLNLLQDGLDPLGVAGVAYGPIDPANIRPPEALHAASIPVPAFDDMPLNEYFAPEITLPILSSRGCYWGKCEFCHHGMVYGGSYSAVDVEKLLSDMALLSNKHGASVFSFVDEAIPPKTFRAIGQTFPPRAVTGWTMTGLLKFEKFFDSSDWDNAASVGFRSVYVGLETASEGVSRLLKKFTSLKDIVRNLSDAKKAGIWVHCFAFYGFPGESISDANETHDFLMANQNIIGSIGVGVFALEHGAPIFNHPEAFGVKVLGPRSGALDVYYSYQCEFGIDAALAIELANQTRSAARKIPNYYAGFWMPRDVLACALSRFDGESLIAFTTQLLRDGYELPSESIGCQVRVFDGQGNKAYLVTLAHLRIFEVTNEIKDLLLDAKLQLMPMQLVFDIIPRPTIKP